MTAALVSDLHLGQLHGADLLRRGPVREVLLEALDGVDELILLGDVLELREGPLLPALSASRPFFEALGEALAGRRIVLVPGNHDHRLLAAWLERRRTLETPPPLGVAERVEPAEASEPAATIARWLAPAELELAYPGTWVRDGVYATHGHYLDRHITVPGFEPLGIRLIERLLRRGGAARPGADGYEAVLGPVYALLHELAQAAPPGTAGGARLSQRAYKLLVPPAGGHGPGGSFGAGDVGGRGTGDESGRGAGGEGRGAGDGGRWAGGGGHGAGSGGHEVGSDRRRPSVGRRLLAGAAFPLAVAAVNAAGLGPVRADLSGPELRRAGLRAFDETLRRLNVEAEHVVFGHTHRAGPLPGDEPAEWRHGTTTLVNAGSWVWEPFYVSRNPIESPYWPGNVVLVGDEGPPELRRLLLDRGPAELAPA